MGEGREVKIRDATIKLTDDTLENIKRMAPLLDEAAQNQVFGMIFGLVAQPDNEKKAG